MTFSEPLWLLLAPAILLVAALGARRVRRGREELAGFGARPSARRSGAKPAAAAAAAATGCLLLALTLAGPDGGADRGLRREPAPLVFVLDVSRSMLAEDVAPNRFAAASTRLLERARAEPGRKFGLVTFAGAAREVAPPTADVDALAALLAEIDPKRVADPGSDAARGVERALDRLSKGERGRGGAILVLSDGEWDGSDATAGDAVESARAAGIEVSGECFGTRMPSPIVNRDERGEVGDPGEPAPTTRANPDRLADLGGSDGGAGSSAAGGVEVPEEGSPTAESWLRASALLGLALLAFAHVLEGRES